MFGFGKPGAGVGVQVKGGFGDAEVRVRFGGFQGGRHDLVKERKRGFYQPCRACRRLGVADHGFYGADAAPGAGSVFPVR